MNLRPDGFLMDGADGFAEGGQKHVAAVLLPSEAAAAHCCVEVGSRAGPFGVEFLLVSPADYLALRTTIGVRSDNPVVLRSLQPTLRERWSAAAGRPSPTVAWLTRTMQEQLLPPRPSRATRGSSVGARDRPLRPDRVDPRRNGTPSARAPAPAVDDVDADGSGFRIQANGLMRRTRDGRSLLSDVSLVVEPAELVAIVGGSGAGKTTLLEALAGVRPAEEGTVRLDGQDLYRNLAAWRPSIGYVPQDDIIHADLPLRTTLRYAARLRLGGRATADQIEQRVTDALEALGLAGRSDVPVRSLSGGQRKRASIAVELLTRPRAFFLDEPTSGLDPATGAELVRVLRGLAARGTAVLFTTHAPQDVTACDRIVFLAEGGHLAFVGSPPDALAYFGVEAIERIYEAVATEQTPEEWDRRFREHVAPPAQTASPSRPTPARATQAGAVQQWWVLTRRTVETLFRNRLTVAILFGSPVMIVAMFAILFRAGAFDPTHPEPSAILMILFWVTFAAFFFGITYGLLQIVTERPILRREHLSGVRLGPYLLSKATVLLPFLVAVDALVLGVLRGLGRLPAARLEVYVSVGGSLALLAAASLGLGLLTSAAVANASQATLALPLLSFPAVLFSGAILPVHIMAGVGVGVGLFVPVRWAFEAVGHDLGVRALLSNGHSPLGPPLVASYGNAGSHAIGFYWAILGAFVLASFLAAWLVLRRNAAGPVR